MKANKLGAEIYINNFIAGYGHLLFETHLNEKIESFLNSLSSGLDDLISELLFEMRSVSAADAASIYVVDKEVLRFVYVQNDSLAPRSGGVCDGKEINHFAGKSIPIGEESICGYVAKTKRPLLISDVRNPPEVMPFKFNDEYDRTTGYVTVSAMTVPIVDDMGDLAGILQLINHKDENGEFAPFEDWMLGYVLLLTENFFPMIARSFDRYRSAPKEAAIADAPFQNLYDSIRGQLYRPDVKLNENLPWLANSGISWTKRDRRKESNISKRLISYADYVNRFEDINTVIDIMLTEARDATAADAGTFYLVEGDNLRFAYVQNDTLFKDNTQRHHYVNSVIPISDRSIGGYAALKRESLNIPDVSKIPESVPYSFNHSFDDASGYHTVSMLAVPILGVGGAPLAVLQLINSKDASGRIKPFDEPDIRYVNLLAGQTMPFLTRSIMTRRLIDSMLKMSSMRDPLETGAHVNRVGAFAAEIYHCWALRHGIDENTLRVEKDTIRLAAMLHDIGKVAVPDAVLKKPGKLTDNEYEIMKKHCSAGASMYAAADSKLERMAYQITLHHHQRWDGSGYTGDPDCPSLSGEDIPLPARITAVADVLDALVFSRVYKSAWTFDDAVAELSKSAGTQFDPEIVRAAMEVSDTLRAIVNRFR
ncbi:MAG: GAF domain-containing protein [Synergistaceae bacterium]|nr:GAF domain-containing protein [Synergistaceae bacterium]